MPTRDGWATSAEPGDDVSAFARCRAQPSANVVVAGSYAFVNGQSPDGYSDQGAESEPTSTMLLGSATLPGPALLSPRGYPDTVRA